jgi:sensor domain CHASE-containing protein
MSEFWKEYKLGPMAGFELQYLLRSVGASDYELDVTLKARPHPERASQPWDPVRRSGGTVLRFLEAPTVLVARLILERHDRCENTGTRIALSRFARTLCEDVYEHDRALREEIRSWGISL